MNIYLKIHSKVLNRIIPFLKKHTKNHVAIQGSRELRFFTKQKPTTHLSPKWGRGQKRYIVRTNKNYI